MNTNTLRRENRRFRGTRGVSQNNRGFGFRPAFLDTATGTIHLSCFANGNPAPIHLLDGLPEALVEARDASGHVARTKVTVISGFERSGRFHTREEALRLAS